jgi:hypothetical protein
MGYDRLKKARDSGRCFAPDSEYKEVIPANEGGEKQYIIVII